jgi:hypothetical protein
MAELAANQVTCVTRGRPEGTATSRRHLPLLLALLLVSAGCTYRTVTVRSDPPGALVSVVPWRGKLVTATPGQLRLRASRDYTLCAKKDGYKTAFANAPATLGFWWVWPINRIIADTGAYDSEVAFKLEEGHSDTVCSMVREP